MGEKKDEKAEKAETKAEEKKPDPKPKSEAKTEKAEKPAAADKPDAKPDKKEEPKADDKPAEKGEAKPEKAEKPADKPDAKPDKKEEPKADDKLEPEKPADEPVHDLIEPEEEPPKKKSGAIYNVILVVGIVLVALGVAYVGLKYLKDWRDAKMYQDTVDTYVTVNDSTPTTTVEPTDNGVVVESTEAEESTEEATEIPMNPDIPWYEQISVNFDELNNVNPDIVAWIYQENGSISYPVLYSGDNEKYLRETYLGVEATAGSIFVGGYNNPDFNDPLTMVYGHNMNNGTMFGSLKKYRNEPEPDYYNEHQYFQIYTEDGMAYRYQVYAYFNIPEDELEMEYVDFDNPDNDMTYEDYLDTIASRDVLGSGIKVTTDDKVLGLWTCANYGTKRFLVFAVEVDEHDFNAPEEDMEETS